MSPKVSVIIPVYNVEKYLQQCLLSVMHQTLEEIEIICVNDGSTDSSGEILEYYAQKDTRIEVITTVNKGYGHAMNTGLNIAEGEYIGIVEPDDYVDIQMFEYLYDTAKIQDADIVKSDFYRFTKGEENIQFFLQKVANTKCAYHRLIQPENEMECFRNIVNIWCGIYRREMIEKSQVWFNETPGAAFQDNGFWFQTLCYCRNIYYVDIPFYMNRRDNPDSSVNNPENIYCCNEEYKFIRGFLKKHKQLEQKFLNGYMVKKYETYMFNISRIRGKPLREYLEYISKEWKMDYIQKDLEEKVFLPNEWKVINQIIDNPVQMAEQFDEKKRIDPYEELKHKNEDLNYQLQEIRKSFSYKIGMMITLIPRKIREIQGEK